MISKLEKSLPPFKTFYSFEVFIVYIEESFSRFLLNKSLFSRSFLKLVKSTNFFSLLSRTFTILNM